MMKHLHSEVPASLLRFIREGTSFIIAGHKEPDGDCVGSQLAMGSVLSRLGKKTVLCSAGPFKRPEVKPYEKFFLPVPADTSGMRVLVMDCSTLDRIGGLSLEGLPAAVIDHHAAGNPWGEAIYLDPAAPSVTFLVLKVLDALDMEPTPEEAELLLFGLCTDTGFFRHVDSSGTAAFAAAARLTALGANPKTVFAAMNGGKTLASRILMGLILSRTKAHYDGRLLVSREEYEDTRLFGEESRDSDMLYQLLQSVTGVEAIAIVRQETPSNCTLGLRSLDRIDVSSIAIQFGGGGHRNAAGASFEGDIDNLEKKVIAAFDPFFG